MKPIFTHERLLQVLRYDRVSGIFRWRAAIGRRIRVGAVAGCTGPDGYVRIEIDGVTYYAHRLARFYVLGSWPVNQVDHIHGVEAGNGWDNLRDATHAENNRNSARRNNRCGWKGVKQSRAPGRWSSKIQVDLKSTHRGTFATPEAAHAAYAAAAVVHHGEFARTA